MAFKLQVEERSENPLEWEFIDPTTPGKPLFTVTHPNVDGHHGGDHSYSFKDFRDDKEGYKFATIGPRIKPYKVEIIPCLEATYVDTWLQLYDEYGPTFPHVESPLLTCNLQRYRRQVPF